MFTEKLFFYPDCINYGGYPLKNESQSFKDIYIKVNTEVTLHGWFVTPLNLKAKATIIHFHGNAANITNHWSQVDWIPKQGYNLFTFDYRGFGESTGKTTFSGIHEDCLTVISYVRKKLDNTKKLILLAQSLGGSFCLSATAQDKGKDIKCIILDSCFDSFKNIATAKISMIPNSIASFATNFLISDEYSPLKSIKSLKSLQIPKLHIHSKSDQVIPFDLGFNLFNSGSQPKIFLPLEWERHIATFVERAPENMSQVQRFLDNCIVEQN